MRAGIFLADGTGAGKTNEILGTILDNVLHGRAKNILVLAKRRHRHGFLEAWAKMGRDRRDFVFRSEEHTSELQSLMRISYAVFCLKKKNKYYNTKLSHIAQLLASTIKKK